MVIKACCDGASERGCGCSVSASPIFITGLKKTTLILKTNSKALKLDELYWFGGQKSASEIHENAYNDCGKPIPAPNRWQANHCARQTINRSPHHRWQANQLTIDAKPIIVPDSSIWNGQRWIIGAYPADCWCRFSAALMQVFIVQTVISAMLMLFIPVNIFSM